MADGPTVRIEASSRLQALLDAEEWVYVGNTVCEPTRDIIRLVGDATTGVVAWVVYEALALDLLQLMRLYPHEDGFAIRRSAPLETPEESDAPTYRALRHRSSFWHEFQHWMRLARLTGRVIHFHRSPPKPDSDGRNAIVTFRPNGRIEEHLSFARSLRNNGTFDEYVKYKRGIVMAKYDP